MRITEEWRKSSKSPDFNNCVEVRHYGSSTDVEVRNSKRPEVGSVVFTAGEWEAFTAGVKAEEFEI